MSLGIYVDRIIAYYWMYEWRAKTQMVLVHVQDDWILHILCIFEGTFSLEVAHMELKCPNIQGIYGISFLFTPESLSVCIVFD